ncbi:MAG: glyoxalase/bleomycin resistance/dioxygenase family protein [Thermoleophilia bacterium]|nr:glyoxalase/bleomycin resistance/dioxygenase family protein [Thermoleophilia bacterium]
MPDAALPPLVTGVDFVSLFARDLEVARTFYAEVLRLPLLTDRAPYNLEFQVGNVTLSLLDAAQMGNGMEHAVNTGVIALHVDDVAVARAELEAAGVTFTRDTIDTGVCHMGLFTDPDGNAFMLHHRYAPKEN